jgi:hypothetical protein
MNWPKLLPAALDAGAGVLSGAGRHYGCDPYDCLTVLPEYLSRSVLTRSG